MRFLRRFTVALLALLLAVAAAAGWLAGTESGLHVLWSRLLGPAVPALAIGTVQGRLAGPLRLTDVRFENDGMLFVARTLELDWTPASLRNGVLRIERLAGTGVRYEQRAPGEGGPVELPARFSLPLDLEVLLLDVQGLVIVAAPDAAPLAFDAVSLAGDWRDVVLDIRDIRVAHPAFRVEGVLGVHAEAAYPVTGDVHWQATPPGYAPVAARTGLSGSLQALHIEQATEAPYALQLDLTVAAPLAAPRLDGTAMFADSDLAAIHADWPDLRVTGRVTAAGPFDALTFDGSLQAQDPLAGVLRLLFAGALLPDALRFDNLQLAADDRPARLDARGRIGFGDRPAFDFQAQWQALAWPLTGAPDYASQAGRFTLAGTPDAYRLEATGDLRILDVLAGELALAARSADAPGSWRIEQARLSGDASFIEASGQLGTANELAWRVHAPRLADLVPQGAGELEAHGTLRGTFREPVLDLQARGAGLLVRDYRVGDLDADARLDLAGGSASRIEVALREAVLPGARIEHASARGDGTRARHRLHVQAASDRGSADLAVQGAWDGTGWRFDLTGAELAPAALAAWRLAEPVSGTLSQAGLQVPAHCWTSGPARACGHFAGAAQDFEGGFTLTGLPVAYFDPLFTTPANLSGVVDGQGDFSRAAGQPLRVSARLASTPLLLQLSPDDADAAQAFRFAPAQLTFSVAQERATFALALPFADGPGGLQARAGLVQPADGDWLGARLSGELALDWPDIGLAAHWLPEVAELRGRIDGRLQVEGTPAAPQLQGRVALREGAATLVTPELALTDVQVELAGQPAGDVRLTASARAGGGTLQGDGYASPVARTASLTLRGERFQVMDTPEAKIFATPDLQLEMDGEQARITGRIDVPRARLRPHRPPPAAVAVSSDQVIVAGDEAAQVSRYPVTARVRLVLGDDVDIDGLGLSGRLRGDVVVTDLPGQPATASGELSIDKGRYEAYGQQLEIRTGRLLYAGGAVTAPGVDIEAVRKPAPDLVVGVRARGRLRAPEFTVFSEPVMPQSQQLSWLVLGRPLEGGTTDSERSAMQSAALMLGLTGGEALGKRIGESLGFDEVTVGSDPGEGVTQASLLVGKYLTPELFVSYGVGLFEPVSTLRLRYALSSRWKLVGQAAALGSSADLFYEIERRK